MFTLQSYLAEQWQDMAELHFNFKIDDEYAISHFSEDGEYQFEQIIEKLAKWVEPDRLWQELHQLALNLTDLKNRLAQKGVPESILNYPAIGFDYLPEKLKRWGLLK